MNLVVIYLMIWAPPPKGAGSPDYADSMITKKMGQKGISSIEKSNIIYDSINGMMKVAFKINSDLLDYLTEYNDIHHLL
jgi:hypothetical protein